MCKSNKESANQTGSEEEAVQPVPIDMIENRTVNPDDCRLTIKVLSFEEGIIEGGIVEIHEKGFGFSDYVNSGDTREFSYPGDLELKVGTVITGVITAIGTTRNQMYRLKDVKIVK